ncbi:uncharacterized protein LOC144350619 [Saccoglossus kowalevskii]
MTEDALGKMNKHIAEKSDIPELFDHNEGGDLISMSISVINVLDDNNKLGAFSFYVASGYNLYSIMQGLKIFSHGDFKYVVKMEPPLGHFIESMYGIKGDNVAKTYWSISNHDEQLSVGVDDYYPENGNQIFFKFISYAE